MTVTAVVSTRWVMVNWTDPPADRYPTAITSYTLYTRVFSHNKTLPLESQQHSYNITGLAAGGVLIVGVAYISGVYTSNISQLLHLETLEGTYIHIYVFGSQLCGFFQK